MFDINKIARPNVLKLKPYQSARDEFKGKARVYLDANENPFGFGLNRYPDASMKELKNAFAGFRNINPNRLIFGNGSDELIDLLIRSVCEPRKDKILVFPPTFGMYRVCAEINNVEILEQPLDANFNIDLESLTPRFSDPDLKIIFICSPNNPSGNLVDQEAILKICDSFSGLVIVDEAYADFSENSLVAFEPKNLFILQTFSKAFGLAGIRLGVGIGDTSIIELLTKIKPPYNVGTLAQEKALNVLGKTEELNKTIAIIKSERERMTSELRAIPNVEKIHPSDANFLLVKFSDAQAVYDDLLEKGIVVRNRSSQVENTLRITIGSPEENDVLLGALSGRVAQRMGRIGECVRKTSETEIQVKVNLDSAGTAAINTGIPFFDHMLDQLSRHGQIGLQVIARGDLQIDPHHTIEDTALALGSAFDDALGTRGGIERYGFLLPMDDCLAQVAIDFGGRPWLEWEANFKAAQVGDMPTEMVFHFFKSFSDAARCNLNIKAEGDNDHHKIESIFKALAKAIKMAVKKDESGIMPSTKGVL